MLVPRGRRGAWFFCLLSSSRASGCDAEPQLQQGSGCQPKACVASLGASMCWCFVASVAKQSRRVRYQFRVCLCCQVSSWCTALEPFCLVCYECGSEYLAPPQGKVRRGTSEQSDIKVYSLGVLALCTQPLLSPGLAQVETALPGCGGPDPRGCPSSPQDISPGMVLVPMLSAPVCLPAALLPSPMVGAESIEAA